MRAYNLFRRKGRAALFCAVPEDLAVPSFVTDENWAFERTIGAGGAMPPGFDEVGAEIGARFNGFYLFQEI
jgi:hypothetical protein